jgi:predicted ATPase
MNNIFLNGSCWLRADFHAHTRADKEFQYSPNEGITDTVGNFAKEYVTKLSSEGVQVAAITNHNKFDLEEFKQLSKRGKKKDILFLAGTELSVNDGANGVHCLIIFSESWYDNAEGEDYINLFLTQVFEDTANRENENARCKKNLNDVLKLLKERKDKGKDSFVILAHVEDRCGFFNEFEGGRIQSIVKEKHFQELVLGLQKVRTHDKYLTWEKWFKNVGATMPSQVEGSDCKDMNQVGTAHQQKDISGEKKDRTTYIKIGHPSFDAVKFALQNLSNRISPNSLPEKTHTVIKSVEFTGGKLSEKKILFNEDLNCLIGLPGSGKSSIIETIRYVLGYNFPLEKKNKGYNQEYKEKLVEHFLGSGGKGVVTVQNKHGIEYTIERTLHYESIIKNEQGEILTVDVQELIGYLYFGQKDLTYQNKSDFNFNFVRKFFQKDVRDLERKINANSEKVKVLLSKIGAIEELKEQKQVLIQEQSLIHEKIRLYKKHDIDKKMKRQKFFEDDITFLKESTSNAEDSLIHIYNLILESINSFDNLVIPESIDNKKEIGEVAEEVTTILQILNECLEKIDEILPVEEGESISEKKNGVQILQTLLQKILAKEADFKEEFEEIRREIKAKDIDIDAYPEITRRKVEVKNKISEINEKIQLEDVLTQDLNNSLNELRGAWTNEKSFYREAIKEINDKKLSVSVVLHESGSKKHLSSELQKVCSGHNIRTQRFEDISNAFNDAIEIWEALVKDDKKIKLLLPNEAHYLGFKSSFEAERSNLLTYKTPHLIELLYQSKPIEKHSDGQKASALILFTLSIGKQDLLIIDQPEDDLNSADIYKEIVSTLLKSKNSAQFMFATHDANITVLGDCEQVLCCNYYNDKMDYISGSVDDYSSQKSIIHIMEGGEEAFSERNKIYSTWSKIT